MPIQEHLKDPKIIYQGFLSVSSGKNIKFETSPDGVEIINITVPEGETYTLDVCVAVTKNG